jgi:nucleotide-binding universal stress UspA family protein
MGTGFTIETEQPVTATHHRIVAGFDGSDGSAAAVEWAAREALARGSTLRVVTCSAVPPAIDYSGVGSRQVLSLSEAVEATRRRHPGLVVQQSATHLDASSALLAEATEADLLVIGSSERGAARGLLFGSVARTAARRSPCPVVIVRGCRTRPVRRIVVAVDGSNAASTAVDWACDEAERHRAEILVVHAREGDLSRAEAQCIVDLTVNECRERTTRPVRGDLLEGEPAAAITGASHDADLIAIGSRGRSGFKTALFGSVALSVAEHAACPVAITHPRVRPG